MEKKDIISRIYEPIIDNNDEMKKKSRNHFDNFIEEIKKSVYRYVDKLFLRYKIELTPQEAKQYKGISLGFVSSECYEKGIYKKAIDEIVSSYYLNSPIDYKQLIKKFGIDNIIIFTLVPASLMLDYLYPSLSNLTEMEKELIEARKGEEVWKQAFEKSKNEIDKTINENRKKIENMCGSYIEACETYKRDNPTREELEFISKVPKNIWKHQFSNYIFLTALEKALKSKVKLSNPKGSNKEFWIGAYEIINEKFKNALSDSKVKKTSYNDNYGYNKQGNDDYNSSPDSEDNMNDDNDAGDNY